MILLDSDLCPGEDDSEELVVLSHFDYKESPERSIRGQTTLDEAEALRDEGIEFSQNNSVCQWKCN